MARSGSSTILKPVEFDQGHLASGANFSSPQSKRPPLLQSSVAMSKEIVMSAASVLSPPQSEYAIFLQSQSPKIRDGLEIIETRKQRLLETQTKNLIGTDEKHSRPMSAAAMFKRSTSPSEKATKMANVAGSPSCNIKMGDSRVFAGSNL